MFHGVIHKITLAQFFLRHGVLVHICHCAMCMYNFLTFFVESTRMFSSSSICICIVFILKQLYVLGGQHSWPQGFLETWLCINVLLLLLLSLLFEPNKYLLLLLFSQVALCVTEAYSQSNMMLVSIFFPELEKSRFFLEKVLSFLKVFKVF